MNFRRVFWRYAYRRYQIRKPSFVREQLAFGVAMFFGIVYAIAFWQDFEANLQVIPGVIVFVVLPIVLAIAHRRIRIERAKSGDALYRKMLAHNG